MLIVFCCVSFSSTGKKRAHDSPPPIHWAWFWGLAGRNIEHFVPPSKMKQSQKSMPKGVGIYIWEWFETSAVYTGIKKPESFSHSGFSLKVARQLPLNTPKKTNRKTHLRSVIFWNSVKISLVFCQCKRSLQSCRYYSGFWSRDTWPSAESPDCGLWRNAHYTCTVKGREKSRMRTTYQNISMRFGVFRACAFRAKNPECYGFFWQYKRYNNKNRFFGFWFLPM